MIVHFRAPFRSEYAFVEDGVLPYTEAGSPPGKVEVPSRTGGRVEDAIDR